MVLHHLKIAIIMRPFEDDSPNPNHHSGNVTVDVIVIIIHPRICSTIIHHISWYISIIFRSYVWISTFNYYYIGCELLLYWTLTYYWIPILVRHQPESLLPHPWTPHRLSAIHAIHCWSSWRVLQAISLRTYQEALRCCVKWLCFNGTLGYSNRQQKCRKVFPGWYR